MNDGGNPNPINPTPEGVVNNAVNPLDKLEGVVAAAQQEAAAAQTPEGQFATQFGEPSTSPPTESAPDLMGQALANLGGTPPDVSSNIQPPAEATVVPQPEEAPLDPKQKFINIVGTAYEELKASEENNPPSS